MFNFKQIPSYFSKFFKKFKMLFTKPQYENFQRFVAGLILSERKNVQEINALYGDKDQSSLNRFVTNSDWDLDQVNMLRLRLARDVLYRSGEEGLIVFDDTMCCKTGKCMEKANWHRSGVTKKKEWGHTLVDSLYVGQDNERRFPISMQHYLRKSDTDVRHPFKTKRTIALEEIDLALSQNIKGIACADAWYHSQEFVQELKKRELAYLLGVRTTLKISVQRKKRMSIKEYFEQLTIKDFVLYERSGAKYFLHAQEVSIRGNGVNMLLISYKEGDEKNVKCYITNILDWTQEHYMKILLKRWSIEVLHRDTKQHLGLEEYQVRKYRGMQVVALAVLVAYTLLILNAATSLLKNFRPLHTIGEMCRFAKLAAQKSKFWLKKIFSDIKEGARVLNQLVLVKNAKV